MSDNESIENIIIDVNNKKKIKKPKIKAIGKKYGFSLNNKIDLENILDKLNQELLTQENKNDNEKYNELKVEISVIKIHYTQRLPIELCKLYLNLGKKCEFNDAEILFIACVKHQKKLLLQKKFSEKKNIKHVVDGIEYPCKIEYNTNTCDCGVKGYIWQIPNDLTYERSYWLQDRHLPLINIKNEPFLSMFDEYNILQNYIKKNPKILRKNPKPNWIHNRTLGKRLSIYPLYYHKYWEWEHLPSEKEPDTEQLWKAYFKTTGCSNHRDMIETLHAQYYSMNKDKFKGKQKIDFRYGVTLDSMSS